MAGKRSKSPTASLGPPVVAVGTSFFRQKYLFAFASQPEIREYLRTQAASEEAARLTTILDAWAAAQPIVRELLTTENGLAEKISIENMPEDYRPRIERLLDDDLLRKTFSLQWSVQLIEIDKLVAAQRTVNLEHVDRLEKSFPKKLTTDALIDICLSPKGSPAAIQHLELGPNAHAFSSPSSDLRFLGAFLKEELTQDDLKYAQRGGIPATAIVSFVGYGAAPVNVFWSNNRVVLSNGFHRTYALRKCGVEKIPVIFQQATNLQLEFPAQVAGLPREYLLGFPRPVLMKDFFVEKFTTVLKVKNRVKLVTLQSQLGQHDVPA